MFWKNSHMIYDISQLTVYRASCRDAYYSCSCAFTTHATITCTYYSSTFVNYYFIIRLYEHNIIYIYLNRLSIFLNMYLYLRIFVYIYKVCIPSTKMYAYLHIIYLCDQRRTNGWRFTQVRSPCFYCQQQRQQNTKQETTCSKCYHTQKQYLPCC